MLLVKVYSIDDLVKAGSWDNPYKQTWTFQRKGKTITAHRRLASRLPLTAEQKSAAIKHRKDLDAKIEARSPEEKKKWDDKYESDFKDSFGMTSKEADKMSPQKFHSIRKKHQAQKKAEREARMSPDEREHLKKLQSITINKARTPGAKDKQPRRKRGAIHSVLSVGGYEKGSLKHPKVDFYHKKDSQGMTTGDLVLVNKKTGDWSHYTNEKGFVKQGSSHEDLRDYISKK